MLAAVRKYAEARAAEYDVFSRPHAEKKAPVPIMERQFILVESLHIRNSRIEGAIELHTQDIKKTHIFIMVV